MPDTPSPSDEQLVKALRAGDESAFRTLVTRHHDDLIRFLTRLVGDRTAAEDVFQDTFLQVYISADTFDVSRRFRPWLFTIAANKGRDYLRRKGRRRMVELSAPVGGDQINQGLAAAEDHVGLPVRPWPWFPAASRPRS